MNAQSKAVAALERVHGAPVMKLEHEGHGSKTILLVFHHNYAYTVSMSGTLELFTVVTV